MEISYKRKLIETLQMLITPLVESSKITVDKEGDQWRVNITSDQNELLVGHKGEHIRAIQHITRVIIHRKFPSDRTHFLIDIGEFRRNREKTIREKILIIANREVITLGSTVIVMGLNGYERKLVHDILADVDGLETTSIGENEKRRLIIRPTSEVGSKGLDQALIYTMKDLEQVQE